MEECHCVVIGDGNGGARGAHAPTQVWNRGAQGDTALGYKVYTCRQLASCTCIHSCFFE